MISLPESLLAEVDDIVSLEKRNRSEFIREAINSILLERRKKGMREQMRKGYIEMAQLNLAMAREFVPVENEAHAYAEKRTWSVGDEY